MSVRRVYVEKKKPYAVQAKHLRHDVRNFLGIKIDDMRVFIRYDSENISDATFETACKTVFSEPPVDDIYQEKLPLDEGTRAFSVEFLPGQFDQRADSAVQCIKFLNENEDPIIQTAVVYAVIGNITDDEFNRIKGYLINPVDSREAGLDKPDTLVVNYPEPEDVKTFDGFADSPEAELKKLYDSLGLAMTFKDFLHIQNYFKNDEHRDPTVTEIRVLDTYWSDHCRHTTFSTELTGVKFDDGAYKAAFEKSFEEYMNTRKDLFADRPDKFSCLMDLGTIAAKRLRKEGKLEDEEKSDEINACSIVVPVEIEKDGKKETEEWLVFFKNETHNHPTEIEPFGGAATCLGGAIRDPLSGRGYVYQAMRVTGAADPTKPVSETLPGKLPQKKLVRTAASGYSSYGNQIGLATGYVKEVYHPDYVAKRMEIGAVMGAAPRKNVIRENSDPGDIIILLGGRTGRDGIGGATGSSKAHNVKSIDTCGAEVQKGNAPTERKIQRLFRRPEVTKLIKKCNDFGAGGVSVAIGELADGLVVNMDKVPKKYAGLDGTELAISESQERMAVVVAPKDVQEFLKYAGEENLEAVEVAVVTEEPRLVLQWRGKDVVNIARAFLDTNGAHQETQVEVESPSADSYFDKFALDNVAEDVKNKDYSKALIDTLSDLNECSQKGLVEMFDSSIGAGSVVMPYGGKYQLTETQAMIAKLPVLEGKTDTVTMMSYGFDPFLSSWSPYHGAIYAVTESLARIAANGGDVSKVRLTFQEYFRRMDERPTRWSQPFAALLGSFDAQIGYGLPSIGGKDSMSGTFGDIDVPPTLVSFAVDISSLKTVITPELKAAGNKLVLFKIKKDKDFKPEYAQVLKLYDAVYKLISDKAVVSAYALDSKGLAVAVAKMGMGCGLGAKIESSVSDKEVFGNGLGNIVAEIPADKISAVSALLGADEYSIVGEVIASGFEYADAKVSYDDLKKAWTGTLESVFHSVSSDEKDKVEIPEFKASEVYVCKNKVAKPTVFIPVFPGTNCEYDSAKAFERAGANADVRVFRNLTAEDIRESVAEFKKAISQAQMIMFPGGFSAGDEPDGSAKFFATAFRNASIKEAVEEMLDKRDGLVLGICNGFQAIIKLGLVPNGKITGQTADSPTLTFNTIGRHISKMAYIKVVSDKSPWLQEAGLGNVYANPASHGEGRFIAPENVLDDLFKNGQIATVYSDPEGNTSMDEYYNINGSFRCVEGITSPDGRVLGKMCHSERIGNGVAINIYGEQDLKIFESGVKYFK